MVDPRNGKQMQGLDKEAGTPSFGGGDGDRSPGSGIVGSQSAERIG